jgi:fatty acid desaturase
MKLLLARLIVGAFLFTALTVLMVVAMLQFGTTYGLMVPVVLVIAWGVLVWAITVIEEEVDDD